ncbi:MAG TPA: hypothetical protein VH092_11295, partial [Urbifossiella sp.]|nr:hypothetical protein [Urbifossiella sp.]
GLVPLAGGGLAVAAAVAAGAGFRAIEVPAAAGETDDVAYVAGLVPFDQNEAGRGFRTAAEQFARVATLPPAPIGPNGRPRRVGERVEQIRSGGVAADDKELAEWVAAVYEMDRGPALPPGAVVAPAAPTWYESVAAAADPAHPVGLFEHPLVTPTTAGSPTLENGRAMGIVVLGHGVFRQAAGDPATFPDDLRAALALARSMRNGSITTALHRGNDLTAVGLAAAARWLARLDGRPDLARRALDEVLRDERAVMTRLLPDGTVVRADVPAAGWGAPFDPTPHQLADRYVVREQMKAPSQWLPGLVTPPGKDREAANPEVDLVSFAWSVPWERERTRRLVAYGLEPGHADGYRRLTRGRPGAALLTVRAAGANELRATDIFLRACRRGLAAQLAVRLYLHDRGVAPPDLSALVAGGYLPAVPPDPFSPTGAPFGYRVPAADETLPPNPPPSPNPAATPGPAAPGMNVVVRAQPPVPVRAGQPIIWSVGPDGADDGGRSAPLVVAAPARANDLVFLVPLPPGKP